MAVGAHKPMALQGGGTLCVLGAAACPKHIPGFNMILQELNEVLRFLGASWEVLGGPRKSWEVVGSPGKS